MPIKIARLYKCHSALPCYECLSFSVPLIHRHFPTPSSFKSNPVCFAIVLCPSDHALGKIKGQKTRSQTHRKFSLLVEHDIKENRPSLRLLKKPKEVMEGLLLWSDWVLIAHESLNARQLKGVPKLEFLALETPCGPQRCLKLCGTLEGTRGGPFQCPIANKQWECQGAHRWWKD